MWWNISKTLSYNALFNFIIGNRGGGKTYGSKKYVIQKFLKTGEQFVYLRRYTTELKSAKPKFFSPMLEEFPECKFSIKGNNFIINNEVAGYAIPLSTAKIQKSNDFPKVTTIIFDEFIIDKGNHHYLSDEVTMFLETYETIARMRDNVKVFFLANAITITNPYFLYFNLKLPYGSKIACKNDVLIELVKDSEYIEAKRRTRFGKIIDGTEYAQYSIENEFLRDNETFIEKKSGNCDFLFSFIYKNTDIGVWANYDAGKIYVSKDIDPTHKKTYSLTKADHTPNTMLISSLKNSRPFRMFIDNYKLGNVYFESINIKNITYDVIRMANIL